MDENQNILQIIGNNIKTARKQRNLSQSELAEKINVSDKFISFFEMGQTRLKNH